jgi:hypothetical protein
MDVRLDSCADQLHITVNDKMKTLDLTCNYLINKLDGFNHGKIAPYVSLGHVTLHG